mmetsp:Transcript_31819/g.67809  ORF Transcript_31819/g.67809 Transcript_31819/m.67809 type:complete len:207 (-) Transcript_31819:302-922(-)
MPTTISFACLPLGSSGDSSPFPFETSFVDSSTFPSENSPSSPLPVAAAGLDDLSGKNIACRLHGAIKSSNFSLSCLKPPLVAYSSFQLLHPDDLSDAAPPTSRLYPAADRPFGIMVDDAGTGQYKKTSVNRSNNAAARTGFDATARFVSRREATAGPSAFFVTLDEASLEFDADDPDLAAATLPAAASPIGLRETDSRHRSIRCQA